MEAVRRMLWRSEAHHLAVIHHSRATKSRRHHARAFGPRFPSGRCRPPPGTHRRDSRGPSWPAYRVRQAPRSPCCTHRTSRDTNFRCRPAIDAVLAEPRLLQIDDAGVQLAQAIVAQSHQGRRQRRIVRPVQADCRGGRVLLGYGLATGIYDLSASLAR